MSETTMNNRGDAVEKPKKTAILLARRIVDDISTGRLRPGTSLPSEKLMLEKYQVGRGTLREALRFLEIQGVIRIKPGPGGGPVVTQPDSRHLASTLALLLQANETPFRVIVEVRCVLEPAMAAMTAENAPPEARAAIASAVDAMERSIDSERVFLAENARFHELVAWHSGNDLFGFLLTSLHWITDGTALGVTYPPARRAAVLRAHRAVADAIVAGDADAAKEAMRTHLAEFERYMAKHFRQVMDEPLRWDRLDV